MNTERQKGIDTYKQNAKKHKAKKQRGTQAKRRIGKHADKQRGIQAEKWRG